MITETTTNTINIKAEDSSIIKMIDKADMATLDKIFEALILKQ